MNKTITFLAIALLTVPTCLFAAQNQKLESVLLEAASAGQTDIVKSFLDNGANVEIKNKLGATPLIFASAKGQSPVVALLLDRGAKVNAKTTTGITPLIAAASGGYMDVVKLLLAKAADACAKDQQGRTASSMAEASGDSEVAELLRSAEKSCAPEKPRVASRDASSSRQRSVETSGSANTETSEPMPGPSQGSDQSPADQQGGQPGGLLNDPIVGQIMSQILGGQTSGPGNVTAIQNADPGAQNPAPIQGGAAQPAQDAKATTTETTKLPNNDTQVTTKDKTGAVVSQTILDPNGKKKEVDRFDDKGTKRSETDFGPDGKKTQVDRFDEKGQKTRHTEFGSDGKKTSTAINRFDSNGKTTSSTLTIFNSDNTKAKLTDRFDSNGNTTSSTDIRFDSNGKKTSRTDTIGDSKKITSTSTTFFDPNGKITSTSTSDGKTKVDTIFGSNGRPTSRNTTDVATNKTTTVQCDAPGKCPVGPHQADTLKANTKPEGLTGAKDKLKTDVSGKTKSNLAGNDHKALHANKQQGLTGANKEKVKAEVLGQIEDKPNVDNKGVNKQFDNKFRTDSNKKNRKEEFSKSATSHGSNVKENVNSQKQFNKFSEGSKHKSQTSSVDKLKGKTKSHDFNVPAGGKARVM